MMNTSPLQRTTNRGSVAEQGRGELPCYSLLLADIIPAFRRLIADWLRICKYMRCGSHSNGEPEKGEEASKIGAEPGSHCGRIRDLRLIWWS
jgi:hypothetical protein